MEPRPLLRRLRSLQVHAAGSGRRGALDGAFALPLLGRAFAWRARRLGFDRRGGDHSWLAGGAAPRASSALRLGKSWDGRDALHHAELSLHDTRPGPELE